jgi:Fe-S-cluster containining protein
MNVKRFSARPVPIAVANTAFPCNGCGLCCTQVHLSSETTFLDRGDGTCRNFDERDRSCSIYSSRPDICRVDRQYEQRFFTQCSWEEFVMLNVQACQSLKDIANKIEIKCLR